MNQKHDAPEGGEDPRFNAIWECIKGWDIGIPDEYGGYCGATGSHVRRILKALAPTPPAPSRLVDATKGALAYLRAKFPADSWSEDQAKAWLDQRGEHATALLAAFDATLSGQQGGAVPAGELEKLRKLSEAATPGPWAPSGFGTQILTGDSWSTICVFNGEAAKDYRRATWEHGPQREAVEANAFLHRSRRQLRPCPPRRAARHLALACPHPYRLARGDGMRHLSIGMMAMLAMTQVPRGSIVVTVDDTRVRRRATPIDANAAKPQFRHAPAPLPRYPSQAERDAYYAAASRRARRNAKRVPRPASSPLQEVRA